MNVVIRTDASVEIGTGHVMRCVTLAKQLQREGAEVFFICRSFLGNSISFIQSQGFHVYTLSSYENQNPWHWMRDCWIQDAEETKGIIENSNKQIDLLVVDQYGIDAKWESELRSAVHHIMVIDDLADRPHDCDLLLDQNYYLNMQNRYKGLVSNSCIQLLGPNYVLLRDEFLCIDPKEIKRDGNIKNILVFFGGTDPTGETMKTLQAIQELNIFDVEFNVVVGAANPQKEELEQICERMSNVNFYCQVNNMAELMIEADLAIGAGGATTWERCFLGLPTLIIIVADNQQEVINATAKQGAVFSLGEAKAVTKELIKTSLVCFIENPDRVKLIINCCWGIVSPLQIKKNQVYEKMMKLTAHD